MPTHKQTGCPKIRYFIVAKECSTVDRRSLIASGFICPAYDSAFLHTGAGLKPRLGACVQRDFNEQVLQSLAEALYIV